MIATPCRSVEDMRQPDRQPLPRTGTGILCHDLDACIRLRRVRIRGYRYPPCPPVSAQRRRIQGGDSRNSPSLHRSPAYAIYATVKRPHCRGGLTEGQCLKLYVWRRPYRLSTKTEYCVLSNPYRLRKGRRSPSRSPTKGVSPVTIRYWLRLTSGKTQLATRSVSMRSDVRWPRFAARYRKR